MAKKVAEEVVETEEDEVGGFESVRAVRAGFLAGTCPFRGQPYTPRLDSRCPTTVPAFGLPVLDRPKGETAVAMLHAIPHIPFESYCHTCLDGQVREEEDGRNPSFRVPSVAGKRRGKR